MKTHNFKITKTMMGTEDHGIFVVYLCLDAKGLCGNWGGHCLDEPNGKRGKDSKRLGTAFGMEYIMRILETVGVEKWEDLPGKYVRVECDWGREMGRLGNITDDDKWFDPKELAAKFFSK